MAVLQRLYIELGLRALVASPRDTKILCLQRLIRLYAYGSSTLVLTLFLLGLGNDPGKIGLFMTFTLWGDVVISLILTVVADKIGRRHVLALGGLFMTASGIVFATCSQYWVLVIASIFGVISPSGNEVGPFKAIEESTLSQFVALNDRSSVIAWYTLSGTAGTATGIITFGWILDLLQREHGWRAIDSYRIVFWAYAIIGLIMAGLSLLLSKNCEVVKLEEASTTSEHEPLLQHGDSHAGHPPDNTNSPTSPKSVRPSLLLPAISGHTAKLLVKLCLLFALDSLGAGMSSGAWMVYFFHEKFGLQEGSLGTLFFVTNILSSASNLVAASLARRIGLIKTMVFTHLPASIFLLLLPIPGSKVLAMVLLILRSSITSMDQAPRQAFLAAAVLPEERTAVMGIVNVNKTLAHSLGPIIAGFLAQKGKFKFAFIIAGALKCGYDVLMLAMFLGYRTIEEKAEERIAEPPGVHERSDHERQSNEN